MLTAPTVHGRVIWRIIRSMSREAPKQDIDETAIEIGERGSAAAGIKGVAVSLQRSYEQMGAIRTAKTLPLLNQRSGFDCPGCA